MKVVCVLGVPSCGKTTVCKRISKKGYTYLSEMAQEINKRGVLSSAHAGEEYDQELMRLEFERDAKLDKNGKYVIETWHPGDIVYAKTRSTSVVTEWTKRLEQLMKEHDVVCVLLNIPNETVFERSKEKPEWNQGGMKEKYVAFLDEWKKNAMQTLKELNVKYTVIDARREINDIERELLELLAKSF